MQKEKNPKVLKTKNGRIMLLLKCAVCDNFLLPGDKFMPEMHLRQPVAIDSSGLTSSACGPLTKHK